MTWLSAVNVAAWSACVLPIKSDAAADLHIAFDSSSSLVLSNKHDKQSTAVKCRGVLQVFAMQFITLICVCHRIFLLYSPPLKR
jgi:hypothetical protein